MNHYDLAYWFGLGVASPIWMLRSKSRSKVFRALRERNGIVPPIGADGRVVMIHAVSVGEMNATRSLIDAIRGLDSTLRFVVSVTTDTGFARGRQLYEDVPDVTLIRYPLDFSSRVERLLDTINPALVILMELEVWPNFLRSCRRREIPVMLANGRITEPSYNKYKLVRGVSRAMFSSLSAVCAQDDLYAQRFLDLGAQVERTVITGTIKFDTATVADSVPGDSDLAWTVGLFPGDEFIWVCGSTGPGEEEMILLAYRELLRTKGRLRLAIIPRHPERFDEVARLIESHRFAVVRRSNPGRPGKNSDAIPLVVLGDTMGELRKFYSLADVIFVGRSLVDLGARQHGSDMIEAAALGKAVLVGPHTGNFAEAVRAFKRAEALIEVHGISQLAETVGVLFTTPGEIAAMGERAKRVVIDGKGATSRHASIAMKLLAMRPHAAR